VSADLSLGLILAPTIYGGVLASSGQDWKTIREALPTGVILQIGMGLIYLKYADWFRRKFEINVSQE
jgi:predicted ABC-type sugar transport system permease subunit